MSDTGMRQRLLAILAADAAGYSRLMASDERATVSALDAARAVFGSQVAAHQGRVVDTAGDSVLAAFETAGGAVLAALAVQHELDIASGAVPADRRLHFRIGVHLGDVIEKADGTVYGDGVNIAARLQALAEPGGVTVSDAVKMALRGKVNATFTDLGEQEVKNIPSPVRAYSLQLGPPSASAAPTPAQARTAPRPARAVAIAVGLLVLTALGVAAWLWTESAKREAPPAAAAPQAPAKPSIAVLPFENMGGDPEQSYFADGITEDLITDLSKVAGLFVIARNSTFAYKGKARDVREIARALGVRYVLEGSVRRSGAEVRVNAQLIDAASGGHLWADRFDGEMKNIFSFQDKVTRNVVSALSVELTKEDKARVARKGTENAQAYDVFLKGWQHYLRQTPEDFKTAITSFQKAAELDPKYSRAQAALAATYWEANTRFWGTLLGLPDRRSAAALADKHLALAMRDPTPLAHQVASAMLLHAQQHSEAAAEAQKAVASDPNDPDGYVALARVMSFTGKGEDALKLIERAMSLNPHYPPRYHYERGLAQFAARQNTEAATSLERALALDRDDHWSQRLLLAAYGLLGRAADAKGLADSIRSKERRGQFAFMDPLTVKAVAFWYPFEPPQDAQRFADGLRKAGVPD